MIPTKLTSTKVNSTKNPATGVISTQNPVTMVNSTQAETSVGNFKDLSISHLIFASANTLLQMPPPALFEI